MKMGSLEAAARVFASTKGDFVGRNCFGCNFCYRCRISAHEYVSETGGRDLQAFQ